MKKIFIFSVVIALAATSAFAQTTVSSSFSRQLTVFRTSAAAHFLSELDTEIRTSVVSSGL